MQVTLLAESEHIWEMWLEPGDVGELEATVYSRMGCETGYHSVVG